MRTPGWYDREMGLATLIASAAMLAANAQTAPVAPAAPDLTTIDGTIKELYAVISRPTPGTRDWDRFKNLFDPHARIVVNGMADQDPARSYYASLSPDEYKAQNASVLERTAFTERELGRETTVYGEIAHVTSSYETTIGEAPAQRFQRGVNMIQLYYNKGRWYIQSILYRPADTRNPIPARLLPPR